MGMSEDRNSVGMAALPFAGLILLFVVSAIVKGYVLSLLWAWFVVPLGVPTLTVVQAIGVSLTVGFLTKEWDTSGDDDIGEVTEGVIVLCVYGLGRPVTALAVGYLITCFM